ncbi:hypothetical protein HanPSC8_Chr10g0409391 [Helianthus annuus]|nr:hypothetical protein HanPSC8_Chr10g0409391 [Helianthus annuus]
MLVMEMKVLFSGKMQKHCCRVFLGLRQRYPWPYWSETSGIQSRKVGILKDN